MRDTHYAPLPVWARMKAVKELTGAPENWLYSFAANNPGSTRKFGKGANNGTLVFNVADVCKAIDSMSKDGSEVRS